MPGPSAPTLPSSLLPARAALASLLDAAGDAMLLLDELGRIGFCNRAAMRQLGAEPGQSSAQLGEVIGQAAAAWLVDGLRAGAGAERRHHAALPDGRRATLISWRVGRELALKMQLAEAVAPPAALPPVEPGPTLEMLRMLWASPFPATLQDEAFRLVAVNDAYVAFTGLARDALIGTDPIDLQPPEDRASQRESRGELAERMAVRTVSQLAERRLIDAGGRERWFRISAYRLAADSGEPLLLAVLQDSTAEHVARAQADRSLHELAQWFDMSPTGMLVFDETGLIVRSNPAFEALVGQVPVALPEAQAELQSLLSWNDPPARRALQPSAAPLENQVSLLLPDGRRHRLSARVRGFETDSGQRRYMAVVEDRSAEEDRDLAQLEIGALMDTAGVGVATFDGARGWLRPRAERRRGAAKAVQPGLQSALQSIGRDVVEAESLPEYERLQHALKHGQRVEVRYAVRHPELGRRWLLTRVEPGDGDSQRRTVVTLDVTEQETAQRRNRQLLRELTTILDGTSAGIAYLRGTQLVRCNRRFELMLGLPAGAAAGATASELFGPLPQALQALRSLQVGQSFDTELPVTLDAAAARGSAPRWYSLSVRRADASPGEAEAVAVLTDISRLKSQQAELEALARDRELMFSLSDVGIVYLRAARIERANQAMALLSGYAESELATLSPRELFAHEAAFALHEAQALQVLRQHGRFHEELQLRRRDGSLVWVQVSQRLVDEDDEQSGRICSYVDVDERHRARQALLQQAGRTRAILDSVLVGIVTVGALGIEWMNRSARRMFAGDLADFVGEPISTVATPEADHPLRRTDYLDTLAEGQARTFECRLKARDGREFWVVGNAVVTADESSGAQLTFALLDIDRRRRAELNNAQAQASLQRIIETAPLAITLFDVQSLRVLQSNQMAAAFFGQPLQRLAGQTPRDLMHAEAAAAFEADLHAAASGSEVLQRELAFERPQGARCWDTRLVSLPSHGLAGEQVLLVASDVTEQRVQAQARFDAAIAQREMLVKEVHHRIKNNLQGVAGLLQQNAARHPEVAAMLAESVGQVQAIAQVYGLQVGAGGPLRAASVLQAIAQSVQRTFGHTVRVQVQDDGSDGFVMPEAESIPIALTINELLTNAVKHGGSADVRCELSCAEGGVLRMGVRNAGQLPDGFDLAAYPGGVSGLGLVRALLPRRSAELSLRQQGDEVLTEVVLRSPSVQRSANGDRRE